MCCSSSGQCIESKHCYQAVLDTRSLISTPNPLPLTPSVNSSLVPYGPAQQLKPCFKYAEFSSATKISEGRYIVNQTETVVEPELFSQKENILSLINY